MKGIKKLPIFYRVLFLTTFPLIPLFIAVFSSYAKGNKDLTPDIVVILSIYSVLSVIGLATVFCKLYDLAGAGF